MNDVPGNQLRPSAPSRWVGRLAALLALAACVTLGTRTFATPDLGYHLTYGTVFFDTGRLVDTNEDLIYALPPTDLPPAQRPEPGPGSWYDDAGRYRFANANWGTQVLFAALHRLGGLDALMVFRLCMMAALFALLLTAMRRSGVPWPVAGAGILLAVAVAYPRLHMRPGVLGFLLLAGQLAVLLPLADPRRTVTWRAVALLGGLQLVLVNLHSYFLLGLAMTGTFLVDRLLRYGWYRLTPIRWKADRFVSRDPIAWRPVRNDCFRLAVAAGLQTAVCFVNPWTWRLAILPIQTLRFIRRHGIAGGDPSNVTGHPWSRIGEFFGPFAKVGLEYSLATYAFVGLLVLAGLAILLSLVMRRWSLSLLMAGMVTVSLSMRRNMAPAAVVLSPTIIAVFTLAVRRLWGGLSGRVRGTAEIAGGVLVGAAAVFALGSAFSQQWFLRERSTERVGWGWNRLAAPTASADWVNAHQPTGRLWCDFNTTSNVLWLIRPQREVPVVSNSWAMPPAFMREQLDYSFGVSGYRAFDRMIDRKNVQIIVLRVDAPESRLAKNLVQDPNWAVVDLAARYATFLRSDGPNAQLAADSAITPETLDAPRHAAKLAKLDPADHMGVYHGGLLLYHMGWYAPAAGVIAEAMAIQPDYHRGWLMHGKCIGLAGTQRLLNGEAEGRDDLLAARRSFRKALELAGGDYPEARENLQYVNRQLDDLKRGRILYPKGILSPPKDGLPSR